MKAGFVFCEFANIAFDESYSPPQPALSACCKCASLIQETDSENLKYAKFKQIFLRVNIPVLLAWGGQMGRCSNFKFDISEKLAHPRTRRPKTFFFGIFGPLIAVPKETPVVSLGNPRGTTFSLILSIKCVDTVLRWSARVGSCLRGVSEAVRSRGVPQ